MRTIEVQTSDGEVFEVSNIPEEAKITFGATNPASEASRKTAYSSGGYTLRIYRGSRDNGNQLAVFQNVANFRDRSLTIKKMGKKLWIDDEQEERLG